ncbi:MAG: tRNA uridine-5-carboxymethylaminomethyl(34) synthesis GTPase MnmE [Deltaproteobacteria bacterium]|nr:tRNA uridine-5-carboxymethylaminomethyl(34) synthesis GTPase MnmE [Deltaproteobacteria bacterium]
MTMTDTITAISTAWGEGGVGIIRISGPEALAVGQKVFKAKGSPEIKERYLHYGEIACKGSALDNGFLVYMKSPRSYTGEDVVELHCHGGPLILKKVLELVSCSGARLAEPGEFTKRAFLNGKLDLTQAEAVIDVIRAQTDLSLSSARGRLEGSLSKKVNDIKEILLNLLMRIEAELDFSEEEIDELPEDIFLNGLFKAREALETLLSTYEEGKAIRDGVRVLILGRPNVGKSSLLNILLQEERAIVTPVAGTTRDVIEEVINVRGIPVRLMDTAGLRDTTDHVESIGVRLARERIADAQIILFVVDSSLRVHFSEDLELLKGIKDKKILIVANKIDLTQDSDSQELREAFGDYRINFISAKTEAGIEELKDNIYEGSVGHSYGSVGEANPGELVVSIRHRNSLLACLEGIGRTRTAITEKLAKEFIATDLRWSVDRLGEITGETTTEDILERIFSEFCIGK